MLMITSPAILEHMAATYLHRAKLRRHLRSQNPVEPLFLRRNAQNGEGPGTARSQLAGITHITQETSAPLATLTNPEAPHSHNKSHHITETGRESDRYLN